MFVTINLTTQTATMNNLFFRSIRTKLILSFLLVALIPLLLLVYVDKQTTEKILTENAALLFVCIGIIIPLISFIIGQSLIKPLNHLTHSVSQFTERNFDQQIKINSKDETAQLAQSLNQMANQLKESIERLEKRVQEREAELVIAKEQAEVAHEAKNKFMSTVRHDLLSPLNAVLGFAQIMLDDENLPNEHYQNAHIIYNSAEQLLSLISTIGTVAEDPETVIKLETKKRETLLTPQHFQIMSPEWLACLWTAASEADKDRAMMLIQTIPLTETFLITQITALIQHYQFETILYLVDSLISKQ
jgi:nitrate/nitrite-specific signal transduction histidine kinase